MTTANPLSRRQVEVKDLILEGKSNREISTLLNITIDTVKVYTSNIYLKLGVKNRHQLSAREIATLRQRIDRMRMRLAQGTGSMPPPPESSEASR